jgi:hypothetical protein
MGALVLIDAYRVARDRRAAVYRQALFCALVDADPLTNFQPPLTDASIARALAATCKKPSEIAAAKQAAAEEADAAFRHELQGLAVREA